MDDPKLRARLADLAEDYRFQSLIALFNEKRAQIETRILQDYLRGPDAAPVNQRVVDYDRGFLDGIAWLLKQPTDLLRLEQKLNKEPARAANSTSRR